MPRPSNTAERRADIVEAMIRVMARSGYARASVSAIAKEAGLSAGLVHYHFQSKQEILLAAVERLARTVERRIEALTPERPSPLDALDAYVDAHLAGGQGADPAAVACWVALGTEALSAPEVGEAYARVVQADLDRLVAIVRRALEASGADPTDAPRLASGLFASIEGAFRLAAIAPGLIPEGSAAATVRAMARGLLAPRSPSPRPHGSNR